MIEDDHPTKVSTPSNKQLDGHSIKTSSKMSQRKKAEAYKLKRWRNQARQTQVTQK